MPSTLGSRRGAVSGLARRRLKMRLGDLTYTNSPKTGAEARLAVRKA
jgi:hypothetical protein